MSAEAKIYKIALPVPLRRLFDYLPPQTDEYPIARGSRVKVPFGNQELTGIVFGIATHSALSPAQLKPIKSVCDAFPLFPDLLCDFIEKASKYYHHPIGEVAFTGLPPALRHGKPLKQCEATEKAFHYINPGITLNTAQESAIEAILSHQNTFQPFLLEGITGSGKTEVYLQATASVLQQQKQILVLIPEISLTPQTIERFQARFKETVFPYHSKVKDSERARTWNQVRNNEPLIVIGTRSSVFLPFQNLGLIVIDEEHDASFKQQDGFRYSARDLAVWRAQQSHCPIVLGSATPAFETLSNVKMGKYQSLILPHRATVSSLPTMQLIDVRHNRLEGGLSAQLIHKIKQHIDQQGQVLLFINRRGYAPILMCYECGWMAQCDRCDARLTYHHKKKRLICHHCTHQRSVPTVCAHCQAKGIHPVGLGTEKIELVLNEIFPDLPIARIDSDATSQKGTLESLLSMAEKNEARILIGTQMLAKGHHFPHLSLVGIVDADAGLFSTDFRAIEKMAQLIIQVAGRAGRVHHAGEVAIQTFHPDHPLLQQMLKQDYRALAEQLLEERLACHLPPFSHWALLRAESTKSERAEHFLQWLQTELSDKTSLIQMLGPIPSPMIKRQGHFRFQLLLQSMDRKSLHEILSYSTDLIDKQPMAKKVRWSLDVDPTETF
jgi:primosomal protein N' (replication factor Y)